MYPQPLLKPNTNTMKKLYFPSNDRIDDQQGFVLVVALFMVVILVAIGIFATDTAIFETRISTYDKTEKIIFFNQETCLATAKIVPDKWLTVPFIEGDDNTVYYPPPANSSNDSNNNNINDDSEIKNGTKLMGIYEVRHLTKSPADIANLNKASNNIPKVEYRRDPLPGSGYTQGEFEIRQYAITCQSANSDNTVVLQEGVYKVFNKFTEN